jgi:transposase
MSKKYLKQRRHFSPSLRKQVVGLIESGTLSVAAASREYMVSVSSLYRWIYRYSTYNTKGAVMLVDEAGRAEEITALKERIAELERVVGHKQMQIDYYEKFVEFAGEEVGADLKKKYAQQSSVGSPVTIRPTGGR